MALPAENTYILHYLQFLLTKVSLSGLNLPSQKVGLLFHYQVLIYRIYILSWLCQFWNKFQTELAIKGLYKVNIYGMHLRLTKV